jgi:hypothetical protein
VPAAAGVDRTASRAAADRIRARARRLVRGGFDWNALKADRDRDRP